MAEQYKPDRWSFRRAETIAGPTAPAQTSAGNTGSGWAQHRPPPHRCEQISPVKNRMLEIGRRVPGVRKHDDSHAAEDSAGYGRYGRYGRASVAVGEGGEQLTRALSPTGGVFSTTFNWESTTNNLGQELTVRLERRRPKSWRVSLRIRSADATTSCFRSQSRKPVSGNVGKSYSRDRRRYRSS